ncbi:MAG TPA: DUF4258 domain-containing protein [Gammaproteobacteria bacterium]|nr:DUF4258 domain-containing protein [Gammaproteobacteria bacterium]
MRSQRFQRTIGVTRHAQQRMEERGIDDARLLDLIDSGETRYKDATRLWIYKKYADRDDNLLCVAAVLLDDTLVVKTVMHRFELS